MTYDDDYRITSLQSGNILNLTYTANPDGSIETILDNLDSSRSRSFVYDDLNRLTEA